MGDVHADLAALRDECRRSTNPPPYTSERALIERMEALLAAHTPPSEPATEDRPRCTCDGGAYFTSAENRTRHPFLISADCPIHSPARINETTPSAPVADRDAGLSAAAVHRAFHDAWPGPSVPLDLYADSAIWVSMATSLAARAQPEGTERAISSLVQTIGRFSDALEDVVERIETWGALNRTLLLEIASENGWSDLLPDRVGEWTEVQP